MNPLIRRGYKNPLKEQDLWDLDYTDTAEPVASRFERMWFMDQWAFSAFFFTLCNLSTHSFKDHLSIELSIILGVGGCMLVLFQSLSTIVYSFWDRFSFNYWSRRLPLFVDQSKSLQTDSNLFIWLSNIRFLLDPEAPLWHGLLIVGLLLASMLLQSFIIQQYFHQIFRIGMHVCDSFLRSLSAD